MGWNYLFNVHSQTGVVQLVNFGNGQEISSCTLHWAKSLIHDELKWTHWGRDKMDAISQTTLSNAFSWMNMIEFRFKFHWSLFLRVQLTIFHYLSQWRLDCRRIYASLSLNELIHVSKGARGGHFKILTLDLANTLKAWDWCLELSNCSEINSLRPSDAYMRR